ncbi:methyltransferase domain-containing protein [Nocardia inohanensis]|uniref:methyltransferase domain-containing protein n=1 Tax=Nocardia inohanensis TaxID=209246 RepID=UPI000829D35C|nr:class I SAM-dependent methyltransferase [Nocardia inohanensis]
MDRRRLLDIGCGDGRFLAELAAGGHRGPLIGVDTSPAALLGFHRVRPDYPGRARILAGIGTDITDWFADDPGTPWRDPKGYVLAISTVG